MRAAAIAAHDVEGLRGNAALKRITDFAAALCEAPIALVSLVEEQRQSFLARSGLALAETGRDVSFCQHAMRQDGIMVVPDATQDPRFADNALVKGDLTGLVRARRLSRAVTGNIRQNLWFAFGYNALGVPVAAGLLYPAGIMLSPMIAALAMSLSSVSVIGNALRLRMLDLAGAEVRR